MLHDSELDADEVDVDVDVDGWVGSGDDSYDGSPSGAIVRGGKGVGKPAGGLFTSQQCGESPERLYDTPSGGIDARSRPVEEDDPTRAWWTEPATRPRTKDWMA